MRRNAARLGTPCVADPSDRGGDDDNENQADAITDDIPHMLEKDQHP